MTASAICLVSGGLDSAVAAAAIAAEGMDLSFLTLDYGQHARNQEVARARALAEALGARRHEVVTLSWLGRIGGSGLTEAGVRLGAFNSEREYVPFRNSIFLALAVAWAEASGARAVVIGSIGGPWITPDNSPAYFNAMQHLIAVGTQAHPTIAVRAPLGDLSKMEVVKRGLDLGVPFELTWSCHNDAPRACGACSQCTSRLAAFLAAGAGLFDSANGPAWGLPV